MNQETIDLTIADANKISKAFGDACDYSHTPNEELYKKLNVDLEIRAFRWKLTPRDLYFYRRGLNKSISFFTDAIGIILDKILKRAQSKPRSPETERLMKELMNAK